uniref:Trafficking protein particle complex subunit n=1 Tax=Plectus sambesii TaxID=2011161 RepID=A0A914WW72_9BILA
MPIFHVFVVNRAGSLIYDWDMAPRAPELEKTLSFPIDFRLEAIDQRPTVVFGERDGVRVGHVVLAVNGRPVQTGRVSFEGSETDVDVLTYLQDERNFPVSLKFGRPSLTTNEKIILSSMFHSLYAIGAQLSPAAKSSGIRSLDTDQFRLQCFQSTTGTKFVLIADTQSASLDQVLRKIYELYADFALKNPFYSLDMPIRCELFDTALKSLIEKFERSGVVTV